MSSSSRTSDPFGDAGVFIDIEERHFDEAEFMFELWEAALESPNFMLADLASGPEQRLLAHIDALELGGPAVRERLLLPAVESAGSYHERVVVATLAMWPAASELEHERVLAALLGSDDEDQRRGIIQALELLEDPQLDRRLIERLDGADVIGTAGVLETLARRRARIGDWVLHFAGSGDSRVARAAAKLLRHCPDRQALEGIAQLAQSQDPGVRQAALETALVRQVRGAWDLALYWAFVPGESRFRRDALTWVASLGDLATVGRIIGLLESPDHRADAIWALGFSGRVTAVDRCVAFLDHDDVGRLAAEVVCAIAGLSVDSDEFWCVPGSGGDGEALPEPSADRLDASLVPGAEDALPKPDPVAVLSWWGACRERFDPELRYLNGQVLDGAVLLDALREGPLRRRHMLAFELAVRTGGAMDLGTRKLSGQQRRELAGLDLGRVELQRAHGRAYGIR